MGILDLKITDPDRPRGNPWFQTMRTALAQWQIEKRTKRSRAWRLARAILRSDQSEK